MVAIHIVDVLKPRNEARDAGRLIDTYTVCADTPEEAVKAVHEDLAERHSDRPGTTIVHRQQSSGPAIINTNRHVTLGVARGLEVCSSVTIAL